VLNSVTTVTSHQVLVKRPRRPLSRQAAWLAHEMELAGHLTPHRLQQLGGPDSKTIRRLLDGHGTNRDDVLRKVVHGLNEANHQQGRRVTFALLDIPRD
jgi:hypothetical protein